MITWGSRDDLEGWVVFKKEKVLTIWITAVREGIRDCHIQNHGGSKEQCGQIYSELSWSPELN